MQLAPSAPITMGTGSSVPRAGHQSLSRTVTRNHTPRVVSASTFPQLPSGHLQADGAAILSTDTAVAVDVEPSEGVETELQDIANTCNGTLLELMCAKMSRLLFFVSLSSSSTAPQWTQRHEGLIGVPIIAQR